MRVQKRNGELENVSFDKVLQRIRAAARSLSVNPDALAQQVLSRIIDKIHTSELDELTAQMAASLFTTHPDWGTLASRVAVSNQHRSTEPLFSNVIKTLSNQRHRNGAPLSYISAELVDVVATHHVEIDAYIKHERDYLFDYFGFKTLEKSYLLKDTSMKVVERPQHMWMRVALGIWGADLKKAFETYDLLSQKFMTHATPTLFNAGTPRPQLSSCYLLSMSDDSISGIYKTLADCASISKYAGGIGLHLHNIRARGSLIRGTNGTSNGLVPMLRVFNNTARYVDQGGGRRNGSFAMYLEPWHADVEDFLRMKLNTGTEEERARDLFYALWIPDLFMERVEQDSTWSLFCPDEAPGLADVHSEAFNALYQKYEAEGLARKTISARKLWFQILESQIETGTPYLLYKDPANKKSNQQNLGTIKSSNLCTEIIEFSSPEETAVCNLASIALPAFVVEKVFQFDKLREVVAVAVRNLDRIIDINYYPTPETRRSNMRHRPIGIGIQGLADVFALLGHSWESAEAANLNQLIFEHMYYAAVEASLLLAEEKGAYETFVGSPASKGILQPDMWGVTPLSDSTLDWAGLRQRAAKGLRNSLLVAPMPTASTSQILGYNECFEPFTSNLYTRRTLAGEFIVVNKYLIHELIALGLWNDTLKQKIIAQNGSVVGIPEIPADVQERYKTSWEIPQKTIIDMAAARGAFICQSQSLNLFMADPSNARLSSMHFYAWKKGLKTGCYYLRTKAPVVAQKFSVDPRLLAAVQGGVVNAGTSNSDTESSDDEDDRDKQLEARAKAAALERQRLRKEFEESESKNEVCTNCSS
uniref:ribonucleoside-diphosphate reductase n=1 Tax=viral metagenome TaxID=1070528 RepID=A0A6C0DCE0_9ZZZZ